MSAQSFEPRMARLEGAYEQVDRRLESIDRRLEALDWKIDGKIDSLREDLGRRIDGLGWRTTSLIVGTWITVMLAIFFHRG